MSFFSLAKIIICAKKVSFKGTFASISKPVECLDRVLDRVGQIKDDLPSIITRYIPWVNTIPLNQGLVWEPTWKSLPTHRLTQQVWFHRLKLPRTKKLFEHKICVHFLSLRAISFPVPPCWYSFFGATMVSGFFVEQPNKIRPG